MCGIAGAWWGAASAQSPHLSPAQSDSRIAQAFHALRLRGPDDTGEVIQEFPGGRLALLHKRLSVIDLSAGGHQPKVSANGRFTLVFNGEIYNYQELRAQLQLMGRVFQTASDTEVLLQCWEQWGEACLTRLEGMFAFVVWDSQDQSLTLVRDAFGIKPLFYSADRVAGALEFAFGSTSLSVRALRSAASEPDWQRAYDYLVHADYDSDERSFIRGIHHLMPAHLLRVDCPSGQVHSPRRWWQPELAERTGLSFADAAQAVRDQFLSNVKRQMRTDVPLGAALSGGIDSSAVVCAMRHLEPDLPLHTFSFLAEPGPLSEAHWVARVNQCVGATAHTVEASGTQLVADLDAMLAAQEEPFGSTSIYAQFRVFQLAKQAGITVTLDGQGADEMLAGYIGYPGQRMRSLMETGHLTGAARFAHQWGQWPGRRPHQAWMHWLSAVLPPEWELAGRRLMGRSPTPEWLDIGRLRAAGVTLGLPWSNQGVGQAKGRRVMAQMEQALCVRGLPGLLRHGDRNAMNFSVESRVPFLTLELVQLLLAMPESYLIAPNGETKSVFRAAMRNLVPDDVLDRKDKIGFATPELAWLRQAAPLIRPWLQEAQNTIPFLKMEVVLAQFDAVLSGRQPFSWQVWRWVNYVRWYRVTFG